MKPQQNNPPKSNPVAAIAVFILVMAAGGTWVVLHGGAPQAPRHLATEAETAATAAHHQAQAESAPRPQLASALPSRQLTLGEQLTYHIDSSRQLAAVGIAPKAATH